MLHLFKVFILSLIEAITEFLPISSTTHLLMMDKFLLKSNLTENAFFLVFIQLGSLCAIVFYYRNDIKKIFVDTKKLKKEGYIPLFNLINSFLVSIVLGLSFKKFFSNIDFSCSPYFLIILGVVMIFLTKRQSTGHIENLHEITPIRAFFIGVAQAFSIFPGVSRLGITLIVGILANLEKKNAIRFSFLLGMPTMFAGTIYELIILYREHNNQYLAEGIIAFFLTLCFSILIIKIAIKLLTKINIRFFGYYRIILGIILLVLIKVK